MRRFFSMAAAGLALGACGTQDAPGPSGPQVQLAVAPLTLPGVADACYTLEVRNGLGETVWSEQHICASQYGNGKGDITYIGPCDAQEPANTVYLTLENIYGATANPTDYSLGAIADVEWDNPCGKLATGADISPNGDGYGPCQLTYTCRENEDVLVEFDITVMRDANQGFFDVAVNFEDIFCSAKVDTCYADDRPIELLFDRAGDRGPTAVFALACTAGAGSTTDTVLHLSSVAIDCGANGVIAIDPTAGPGNAWTFGGTPDDPDQTDALFQYAVYEGVEQLNCGLASCNKVYWNVALGIDPTTLPAGCSLTALATASDGGFPNALDQITGALPTSASYPVIDVDVPLTANAGALGCTRNPINGDGSGVSTTYTSSLPGVCPLELCYFGDGAATTHVETWQDWTAQGIPGITWAPDTYVMYQEAVGADNAVSLGEFCSEGISRCCLESWLKLAESVGLAGFPGLDIPTHPTTEFCASPGICVENYLKYAEAVGTPVSYTSFVDAGLCTGSCVENYLKYAEAVAGSGGTQTILEVVQAGACTQTCIENYLKYQEAVSPNAESLTTWAAANCD